MKDRLLGFDSWLQCTNFVTLDDLVNLSVCCSFLICKMAMIRFCLARSECLLNASFQ